MVHHSQGGREAVYALSDHMLDVLIHGRAHIFRRREEPWAGRWAMVIYQVPESQRAAREASLTIPKKL